MSATRTLCLLLLCALGIACAKGTQVETSQVTKIRPGATTQAEILDWFGEPDQREILGTEGTRWFYVHEKGSKIDGANVAVDAANVGLDVFRAVGQGARMRLPKAPNSRPRDASTNSLEVAFDLEGIVRDYAYEGR